MKTFQPWFHWIPRILAIAAIGFISLFATDAFQNEHTLSQQLREFFMHLIPSFVLLVVLWLAWKRELTGGILFLSIGLILTPFIYQMNYNVNHSVSMSLGIIAVITLPFIVTGILFIISHHLKKKNLT